MLDLQKASAGSGKTYTLARKYIQYLLTVGEPRRLRTAAELEDSAAHILAITFTNKATMEMKERIVQRLADLADRSIPDEDAEYLEELCACCGSSPQAVRATAAEALALLLNNYNDFQVSTIDSFFQTILRTFAFEIDLSDTYEIELDSDFVATSALDATMSDVNADETPGPASRWFLSIMQQANREGKKWNLFAKADSPGGDYGNDIYSEIVAAVKQMSGERFKNVRARLDDYFRANPDSLDVFRKLDEHFRRRVKVPLEAARSLAETVRRELPSLSVAFSSHNNKVGHVGKVLALKPGDKMPFVMPDYGNEEAMFTSAVRKKGLTEEHRRMQTLFSRMYEAVEEWRRAEEHPDVALWRMYRRKFRLLPLMHIAAGKSADMLRQANVVPMDETNSILRRVIGEDDAPFIYERLGSRMDHYLIDEFQDTSALQWENLTPLVEESMARGNDNLIIGDAKQSIYRFRNADASLITSRVPAQLDGRVNLLGMSRRENTNHRSLRTIVEFNNTIFHSLAAEMDARLASAAYPAFFANLYANVAQYPAKQKRLGYVEICTVNGEKNDDTKRELYYDRLPELVCSLRDRGYRLSEIAFLVREKKNQGRQVIEALMEHNVKHPEQAIEFISDESLLVGRALAVKNIIAVLRLLAEGEMPDSSEKNIDVNDEKTPGPHDADSVSLPLFRCRYEQFALANPHLSPDELMTAYSATAPDDSPLTELLDSLHSVTLTAMVEMITEKFVSPGTRKREAPYLAAFQDLVIDFCERYSGDVQSFLQWWDRTGRTASISSPQGVEAVTIMTIHKAKGLEFPCVILPAVDDDLSVRAEWTWLEPANLHLPPELEALLPPYLPVEIDSKAQGTPHEPLYEELHRNILMDSINIWYVAFTRAKCELYLLLPENANTLGGMIADRLKNEADGTASDSCEWAVDASLVDVEGRPLLQQLSQHASSVITVGSPLTPNEIEEVRNPHKKKGDAKKEKEERPREIVIDDYYVRDPSGFLAFRDAESARGDENDPDPRSFGNRLHEVMSQISVPADLDKALRRSVVDGKLSSEEAHEAEGILRVALADKRTASWFAPGLRVINERPLLRKDTKLRRPDRVVVDGHGVATVVDFKFGTHRDDRNYIRQVRRYISMLRATGRFTTVNGYIWYVLLSEIVEV